MSLELINVQKTYGDDEYSVTALDNINLKINQGEFITIIGKSGSGKSTLLSIICGLEKPTSGSIMFKSTEITKLNQEQLCDLRRENIGIVFQSHHLLNNLSLTDNIELPLIIKGDKKEVRQKKAEELVKLVGLEHRSENFPFELSGGERQRVAIARALTTGNTLILADEPTGNLDFQKSKEIVQILQEINKGAYSDHKPTIVMVTHNEKLIKDNMRVIVLSDGQIVEDNVGKAT
ncbi:MAG: ABC transporter ATP-binding protein [Candidatus Heimdallarchaeota archaeon]|nr:ABC transporter ATP-binding protein [Candidatus Heimdallarchaeota archaeon]MDH5646330.1 ABC transporter ATP-binding protein [Candidatus Heimdallarchaeota archaeon]